MKSTCIGYLGYFSKSNEVQKGILQHLQPRIHSISASKKKELLSHGTSKNNPVPVSKIADSGLSNKNGDYDDTVPNLSTKARRKKSLEHGKNKSRVEPPTKMCKCSASEAI
ncbi:hypothetical protein ACH5RR_026470 [Cinchona calisaya]|uniref:Uncharacterized protein n=1 Tax=Cinchona calisaya TaxID=153742 RepID=A0ABD2Z7P3_9GENT